LKSGGTHTVTFDYATTAQNWKIFTIIRKAAVNIEIPAVFVV
jgi:hypothetical protein